MNAGARTVECGGRPPLLAISRILSLPAMDLFRRSAAHLTCAAIACMLLSGCVERKLIIRSEPPGARVVLNGRSVGTTPVEVPFDTYGVFDVVLSLHGHHRLSGVAPVHPPWFEQIPIDFFVETLWPATVYDIHDFTFTLRPLTPADDERIERSEEQLRARMEE